MLGVAIGKPASQEIMLTSNSLKTQIFLWVFHLLTFTPLTGQIFVKDAQDSSHIPYAIIDQNSPLESHFTDSLGFLIISRKMIGDSITIRAYGYSDTTIVLKKSPFHVYLIQETVLLPEVNTSFNRTGNSKIESWKHDTKVSTLLGFELCRKIQIPKDHFPIKLKRVKIKLSTAEDQPFRLTLYSQQDGLPHKAISKELIRIDPQLTRHKTVNLNTYDIYCWDDFFVGVELVANDNIETTSKRSKIFLSSKGKAQTFFRPYKAYNWEALDTVFPLCQLLNKSQLNLIVEVEYEY